MQAYFGQRGCEVDQVSAILDSNSEETWRETKMRPREWEAERNMVANLRSRAPKRKRLHCRLRARPRVTLAGGLIFSF